MNWLRWQKCYPFSQHWNFCQLHKKSYLAVKRANRRAQYLLNNNSYSHFPRNYITLKNLFGNPVISAIKILIMDLAGNPIEFSDRLPKTCFEEVYFLHVVKWQSGRSVKWSKQPWKNRSQHNKSDCFWLCIWKQSLFMVP